MDCELSTESSTEVESVDPEACVRSSLRNIPGQIHQVYEAEASPVHSASAISLDSSQTRAKTEDDGPTLTGGHKSVNDNLVVIREPVTVVIRQGSDQRSWSRLPGANWESTSS